ncbi:MAG: FkbM family methyltransferase [Woeseiaceae bacterium]
MSMKSVSYVVQRFLLRRQLLTAKTSDGLRFRVSAPDVVGRHIFKYGQHDPAMSAYLRAHVKPNSHDLLIDIGANIGWFTVLLGRACQGTDARVLCFEPDPLNFDLLQQNLSANATDAITTPLALALSDNDEGAVLHQFSEKNRGRHSLLPIHDHDSVQIPTARLDAVIAADADLADRHPAVIKIDIEGYELIALGGAAETLAKCPLVILEFSPHFMRQGGLEPSALLSLMEGHGFVAHVLRDGKAVAVKTNDLLAEDQQVDIIWRRPG